MNRKLVDSGFKINVLKVLIFCAFAIYCPAIIAQKKTTNFQIKATIKPYTSGMCYLAHYYLNEKNFVVVDSALVNKNNVVVFKGDKVLDQGIYVIGYPNKGGITQLLIDEQQQLELVIDTQKPAAFKIKGSKVNTDYNDYQLYVAKRGKIIDSLRNVLTTTKTKKDSTNVFNLLEKTNNELIDYRDKYITKNPNNLLATLFAALRQPNVPKASAHPGGKYDTAYARNFFITHFWDGVDFADDRLLRTPFFQAKFETFFNNVVIDPEEAFKYVDIVLGFSKHNEVMFKFFLNTFTQMYYSPKYMGLEKVYVKLYEKYYANQTYSWITPENGKLIKEKAITTMANMIGDFGYNLALADTTDKVINLYDVKADFTVLCFWDPTCGHCKTTVPILDSFYNAKWKAMGVSLLGILVNKERTEWKKFIQEKKLYNWMHLYQNDELLKKEKESNGWDMRSLYDAYTTPKIFLLDKDKRIVARSLEPPQLDTLMQIKIYGKLKN